jgi:hypothetical protein
MIHISHPDESEPFLLDESRVLTYPTPLIKTEKPYQTCIRIIVYIRKDFWQLWQLLSQINLRLPATFADKTDDALGYLWERSQRLPLT